MLSRLADNLYWMSRYMERAENMARLLEVGYRISLMPGAIEGHRDEWRSTLQSCACDHGYSQKHNEIATAKVMHRIFYRDGLNTTQAIEKARALPEASGRVAKAFVDFAVSTKRGLA